MRNEDGKSMGNILQGKCFSTMNHSNLTQVPPKADHLALFIDPTKSHSVTRAASTCFKINLKIIHREPRNYKFCFSPQISRNETRVYWLCIFRPEASEDYLLGGTEKLSYQWNDIDNSMTLKLTTSTEQLANTCNTRTATLLTTTMLKTCSPDCTSVCHIWAHSNGPHTTNVRLFRPVNLWVILPNYWLPLQLSITRHIFLVVLAHMLIFLLHLIANKKHNRFNMLSTLHHGNFRLIVSRC